MRPWGVLAVVSIASMATAQAGTSGISLSQAARAQVGVTKNDDGSYQRIAYPNGDVPKETGVCTDVVVRAYRIFGVDLQALVHEDMKRAWSAYPNSWPAISSPGSSVREFPTSASYRTSIQDQERPWSSTTSAREPRRRTFSSRMPSRGTIAICRSA